MERRRILYVQHTAAIGGATISLLDLLEYLDKSTYLPLVLFLQEGPAVSLFREKGIETFVEPRISYYPHGEGAYFPVRSLRPWIQVTQLFQLWPSACRARDFIQTHPVDLVHINTSVQIPTLWGAHLAGVPTVFHVREVLRHGNIGLRRAVIRWAIDHWADAVIAIAQHNAVQLKPNSKIRVIYNFVDFEKFDRLIEGDQTREKLGIRVDVPVIGMLGGTVLHKGLLPFLHAARIVHEKCPKVRFLVAGESPQPDLPISKKRRLRHRLEDILAIPNLNREVPTFIEKEGLGGVVLFTGARLDIPSVIAAMDVLVFPATVSHFARPIIEAGAMAKPVIASDFPSTREIVTEGETGLLVPPEDPRALAEAMLRILDDPLLARSMGEAGNQQARQKFDARVNAVAIFAVYEELLSRSSLRGHS